MTMNRMRTRVKRVASFALTTVMALSLVASASITVDAAKSEKAKPSKLSPHDLDLIAAARARGESAITLLIASRRGRNSSVAGAVPGLGGDLRYRHDLDDPRPGNIVAVSPQTAPGASTPNDNPYMPTRDTKASQFVAAHPTWDGRGITIGIVDTGVSLDHPSLLTTSTGERKIVNWVTGRSE